MPSKKYKKYSQRQICNFLSKCTMFPYRRIRSRPSLGSHPSIHKITENACISLPFKGEYRSKSQIYWPEFQFLRLLACVIMSLQHFMQTVDGSWNAVSVPRRMPLWCRSDGDHPESSVLWFPRIKRVSCKHFSWWFYLRRPDYRVSEEAKGES